MAGVLLTAAFLAISSLLVGEEGNGILLLSREQAKWWWERFWWTLLGTLLVAWGIWAWVFYRFSRRASPEDLSARTCRFLLAGSILELLVAVPCHVWIRRRDECCASGLSFWGLAMGIAVMLFSFGPGVLFLYAERVRRLTPKP